MTNHERKARATAAVLVVLAEAGLIDTNMVTPMMLAMRTGLSADDIADAQQHLVHEGVINDRLDGKIEWLPAHKQRVRQLTIDAHAA